MAHAASGSPAAPRLFDPDDRPLTHRDLDHTPDDGNRYELIDGELHVSPFPSTAHQNVISILLLILGNHVRQHGVLRPLQPAQQPAVDE